MASPLQGAGGGGTIPVYTPTDVSNWLSFVATSVGSGTGTLLLIVALLGFFLFCVGIVKYMRHNAQAASGGGGGGSDGNVAVALMVVGALFGAGDVVALFIIGSIQVGQ